MPPQKKKPCADCRGLRKRLQYAEELQEFYAAGMDSLIEDLRELRIRETVRKREETKQRRAHGES